MSKYKQMLERMTPEEQKQWKAKRAADRLKWYQSLPAKERRSFNARNRRQKAIKRNSRSFAQRKVDRKEAAARLAPYLKSRREHNAEYFRNYWANNPDKADAHRLRTDLARFLKTTDWKTSVFQVVHYGCFPSEMKEHLFKKALARGLTNYKGHTIEHIVSLSHFIKFGCTEPKIVHDFLNLDVLSRSENSAKQSVITSEALQVALQLEAKYQNELPGFAAFLATEQANQKVREFA